MTVEEMTTERLREWIADWTLIDLWADEWGADEDVAVRKAIRSDIHADVSCGWWDLRDELLAEYARRGEVPDAE